MCGSVKLEGRGIFTRIGNPIPAEFLTENPHSVDSYLWNGFARADGSVDGSFTMAEQWQPDIWVPEILRIEEFTEKHRKTGKIINIPLRRMGVIVSAEGKLKVITRPSRRPDEVIVHHRTPLRIPAIMTRNQFVNDLNRFAHANYH